MIIPSDAIIAVEKVRDYLLKPLVDGDKSRYLKLGGYERSDYTRLAKDLREQLLPGEGIFQEPTLYGEKYILHGYLNCPNGRELAVKTVWERNDNGEFRFVTLYPGKRRK